MCDLVLSTETGHLFASKVRFLLEMIVEESLKQHIMFYQRNLTICCPVTSKSGIASIYLVK